MMLASGTSATAAARAAMRTTSIDASIGTTGRETAARYAIAPFSYRQNKSEAVGRSVILALAAERESLRIPWRRRSTV